MFTGSLGLVGTVLMVPTLVRNLLFVLVGIAGVVGVVLAATTREDAYEAGSRQSKWVWVGILALASLVCLFRFPFVAWFGAVAVGIYYLDVRPQLNDIIRGNYSW
ncbi:DUF2516 family protein [Corynebacterium sp. UBA2622]|uniref:DUF2516 family protein n=1 Tax=Corynebacterium sp. UBA2622 TaxID=1946393 RepID=UPI0025BB722C|nr:DUF2516 family protein [Corynebacterium sp. UBA2622]